MLKLKKRLSNFKKIWRKDPWMGLLLMVAFIIILPIAICFLPVYWIYRFIDRQLGTDLTDTFE